MKTRSFLRALLVLAAPACSSLLGLQPPPAPSDGAGSDASPIDGAVAPYFRFGSDFETQTLNGWDNLQLGSAAGESLAVTTMTPHAGCCALRATKPVGILTTDHVTSQWTQQHGIAGVVDGTIAVRGYIRAVMLPDDTRELGIDDDTGNPASYITAGLGTTPGGFSYGYVVQSSFGSADVQQAHNPLSDALGGWHCVELVINVGAAGHVTLYMDGSAVVEHDTDTRAGGGWKAASFGLGYASMDGSGDVFLDDVAVALYHDDARAIHLGCN
jgi:hypothetical protein